jgi:RNA polymerase sigma-70 factor (ECF subfamily)
LNDDLRLVEEFRRGDSNSLEMLIEGHWKKVFNFCWRLLGNREDAEETTQRTFIAAFRNIKMFRGDSSFKTWLFSIALNECRMSRRKNRPEAVLSASATEIEGTGNPEDEFYGKERAALLRRALGRLPLRQRAVITLRINEELTFQEIASALQCSVNSAKVNFQHGINRLKEMMGTGENEKE